MTSLVYASFEKLENTRINYIIKGNFAFLETGENKREELVCNLPFALDVHYGPSNN